MSSLLRPAILAFALLALGAVAVALQLWLRHSLPLDPAGLAARYELLASRLAEPPARWSESTRAAAQKILEAGIELRPASDPLRAGEIRVPPAAGADLAVVLRPDRPAALASFWRAQLHAFAVFVAVAFILITAVALASLAPRSPAGSPAAKSEINQLVTLARATAAQGEDLARERDLRARTEQAKTIEQMRATQAVADNIQLGRDLHDGMIQSLYAAGLGLESARQQVVKDPPRAIAQIERARETLNAAIRELRQHLAGLTPQRQLARGFSLAVRGELDSLGGGHAAAFDLGLDPDAVALVAPGQVADLLQIIREAASNALRHGGANTIAVRLQGDAGRLCLVVEDDGRGFAPPDGGPAGHGLANLRARATALRGELSLASAPAGGTRMVLVFPVAAPA